MADRPGSHDPSPTDGDFDRRLAAARKRRETEEAKWTRAETRGPSGLGIGLRIASEIVAAIAVAVALGLMLDGLLGTKPLMLIVFLLLGSGAAMTNVVRTGRELERRQKEAKARAAQSDGAESAAGDE
jgi:ATP synthase protein I